MNAFENQTHEKMFTPNGRWGFHGLLHGKRSGWAWVSKTSGESGVVGRLCFRTAQRCVGPGPAARGPRGPV